MQSPSSRNNDWSVVCKGKEAYEGIFMNFLLMSLILTMVDVNAQQMPEPILRKISMTSQSSFGEAYMKVRNECFGNIDPIMNKVTIDIISMFETSTQDNKLYTVVAACLNHQ